MRRPRAGLAAAQRAGSFTSPISGTENSNQAARAASPARARLRRFRNTVPTASGPGGVPT